MAFSLCTRPQSMYKLKMSKNCIGIVLPRAQVRLYSSIPKHAPLLNPAKNYTIFTRTFFFKIFLKPTPEKLRAADGLPEYYQLIYRNTMHRYLLSAQIFSTLSALIVVIITCINYRNDLFPLQNSSWRSDLPKPIENENLLYVTAFITLCVILQSTISRMPIRIYHLPEKQKYVFIFYGALPMTKRRLICRINDVAKLEETGLLPWKDSRYEIRNKQRIIMLENFFRKPADLSIMLGYQKPPPNYN